MRGKTSGLTGSRSETRLIRGANFQRKALWPIGQRAFCLEDEDVSDLRGGLIELFFEDDSF